MLFWVWVLTKTQMFVNLLYHTDKIICVSITWWLKNYWKGIPNLVVEKQERWKHLLPESLGSKCTLLCWLPFPVNAALWRNTDVANNWILASIVRELHWASGPIVLVLAEPHSLETLVEWTSCWDLSAFLYFFILALSLPEK